MKTSVAIVVISGLIAWVCCAQYAKPSGAAQPGSADNAKPNLPVADPVGRYATLNRRAVEFEVQSELLSQLAQEHRKRAQETPADQTARAQWENEVAQELADRSTAALGLLNSVRKERLAFEQAHPDLAASAGTAGAENADETAFMRKLEERFVAVQQEIADAIDAGKVYTAQLQTNTASLDYSRIASLLQDNSTAVRQLQKEASDLELKKLEFRALRRSHL